MGGGNSVARHLTKGTPHLYALRMLIREAKPADVEEIHAMICELAVYEREPDAVSATAADLAANLFSESPHLFALVAEDENTGEALGMAIWFLNYSTWLGRHGIYLEDLYVREHARGNGIGEALLQRLAQICIDRDYGRLEWWVLDWNISAIEFYRSRGAIAMDEWTVYRVSGEQLSALATGGPQHESR
jgi:GNAT superfamily N-acetyltransferase